MKAFIPEIDSKLRLSKAWTFDLHFEHRNHDILNADGNVKQGRYWFQGDRKPYKRTLPTGTEFLVSRIYVRNGAKDFSSVTLYITKTTDKKLTAIKPNRIPFRSKGIQHYGRFWVKLHDFNNAELEVVEDATQTGKLTWVKGEVMTMKQFRPSSKYPKYWVVFEHPDPELSFDDIVRAVPMRNVSVFHSDRRELQNKSKYRFLKTKEWISRELYSVYKPIYYVENLVPASWYEKHKDQKAFKKKVANPFADVFSGAVLPEQTATTHPLENEINIPREKKDRLPLGIENDQTKLKNIPIAGGKLTIYQVKEDYQ